MGGEQGMEGSVVLQELESHGVGLDEGGTRFVCNGLLGNLHSKKWKRFLKQSMSFLGGCCTCKAIVGRVSSGVWIGLQPQQ